jgi:hypothetical protein
MADRINLTATLRHWMREDEPSMEECFVCEEQCWKGRYTLCAEVIFEGNEPSPNAKRRADIEIGPFCCDCRFTIKLAPVDDEPHDG